MAKITVRTPTGRKVRVGLYDYRSYWLFDTEIIQEGMTEVYFFQSPEGKSAAQTNLKQFSTIQAGWEFEVHAIRVIPEPGISATDAQNLFKNCSLTLLKEGDIEVFAAPAVIFTAGAGVYGFTTEADKSVISNGLPSPTAINKLPIPILIKGGETFNIRILWSPAVSLSRTISLQLVLDGILRRPVRGT